MEKGETWKSWRTHHRLHPENSWACGVSPEGTGHNAQPLSAQVFYGHLDSQRADKYGQSWAGCKDWGTKRRPGKVWVNGVVSMGLHPENLAKG